MKTKERKFAGETLDEALARTAVFDAKVENLPALQARQKNSRANTRWQS